jgi:hypothetical protein
VLSKTETTILHGGIFSAQKDLIASEQTQLLPEIPRTESWEELTAAHGEISQDTDATIIMPRIKGARSPRKAHTYVEILTEQTDPDATIVLPRVKKPAPVLPSK